MIWYKPDNIIFKNRKEAKKYFGTNKYLIIRLCTCYIRNY